MNKTKYVKCFRNSIAYISYFGVKVIHRMVESFFSNGYGGILQVQD